MKRRKPNLRKSACTHASFIAILLALCLRKYNTLAFTFSSTHTTTTRQISSITSSRTPLLTKNIPHLVDWKFKPLFSSPLEKQDETKELVSIDKKKNISSLSLISVLCKTALITILATVLMIGSNTPMLSEAGVQFVNPASAAVAPLADVGLKEFLVKDGNQFLRLSLPTSLPTSADPESLGDTGRAAQQAIELVRLRLEEVGFSGRTPVWNAALKEVNKAKLLFSSEDMLKGITEQKREKAIQLTNIGKEKLDKLAAAVRSQDITSTLTLQEECSSIIYDIRTLSLKPRVLPYSIPAEYSNLPQLRGRATVECNLKKKTGTFSLPDGTKSSEAKLTLVIDGYHAPITGGNFIDLVKRNFYDNMPIEGAEELIVLTGKPPGEKVDGFVDPNTKEKRLIPLELFYKTDLAPTYEYTSDDDMRATESFALPFQAYGALGMDHDVEDVNTASSQFWFLKWDQALVPPSRNTLDGSHTCFGYVVKNQDLLKQMNKGDLIVDMKVVQGSENLFVEKT